MIPKPSIRSILAGLGLVAIIGGLLTIRRPLVIRSVIGPLVTPYLDFLTSEGFPLGLAIILVTIAVIRGAQARLAAASPERRLRPEVERSTTTVPLTGIDFDRSMTERLVEIDRTQTTEPAERLRERLRGTAVDALVAFRDVDRAGAREAVDGGTWTDDPVAAAFLADSSGPSPSFLRRVYAWLYPRTAIERRIDRTVAELQSLTAVGVDDG